MSSLTQFAGSIPLNYDQYLGPLFFEPYALDLFERLKGKKHQRLLELASGTGRLTRHLAELPREGGELYATDLNPDMLQIAKQKAGNNHIHWGVVDAHAIPYEDNFFDAVVCQFGVMFFKDKPRAFSEIYRVLRPGGTFLFSTWDDVQHNAASQISQMVLNEVFPQDAPDFLDKGPYSFFDPTEIRRILKQAGFSAVDITPVAKMGVLQSPDQVAIGFVEGSPLTTYLEERQAPKETIKKRITDVLQKEYTNLQLPMQALVCSAKKVVG